MACIRLSWLVTAFMVAGLAQAQALDEQARNWLRQGQAAQAEQAYTTLIERFPQDPDH